MNLSLRDLAPCPEAPIGTINEHHSIEPSKEVSNVEQGSPYNDPNLTLEQSSPQVPVEVPDSNSTIPLESAEFRCSSSLNRGPA